MAKPKRKCEQNKCLIVDPISRYNRLCLTSQNQKKIDMSKEVKLSLTFSVPDIPLYAAAIVRSVVLCDPAGN